MLIHQDRLTPILDALIHLLMQTEPTNSTKKSQVRDAIVRLDYGDFRDTEFVDCKIIYSGGRPPVLVGNSFDRCEWIFEDSALNTVSFLKALASAGGGFEHLVYNTIFEAKPEENADANE